MNDPFPLFTSFLETILLYLIYVGVVLATISAVVSGILFLPIFGLSAQRAAQGSNALKATVLGLLIILLALPMRNVLLTHFPLPAGIPAVPLFTPVAVPATATVTQ